MKTLTRSVIASLGTVMLLALILCLIAPRLETVPGLTRKDVAEIRNTVRKEVWKEFRKDYSQPGWGHVPGDLWAALRTRISVENLSAQGTATACTRTASRPGEAVEYELQKRSDRWIITQIGGVFFLSIPAANQHMQPDAAMTSLLHAERPLRGAADMRRWAKARTQF